MSYNVILIDLDETILDFRHAEKNAHKLTTLQFDIPYRESDYKVYHEINDALWKELELGLVTREELVIKRFERYLNYLNSSADPKAFNEGYISNLSKGRKLLNGAEQTLKTLYERGKDIYIITNGVKRVQDGRLFGQPFMNYVKGVCISECVGASKPSLDFFKRAEKLFGITFDKNTVVVGDSLSSDIKGANQAGLDSVWINAFNKQNQTSVIPTYEVSKIEEVLDIIK
ncbi:MAG: YjjG family noncanonical pyrimidine nucleotidase [Clostridia bacterium]|nr:YjjG family noncanonical pyrimidine nucleotidase [Clostridia bacterium]